MPPARRTVERRPDRPDRRRSVYEDREPPDRELSLWRAPFNPLSGTFEKRPLWEPWPPGST
jgi:hypothetical protein